MASGTESTLISAFDAIVGFVVDLQAAFNEDNKNQPLALFWRLVTNAKPDDVKVRNGVVTAFISFLTKYEDAIQKGDYGIIPKGSRISYLGSAIIYIDIQKFIIQSDIDTRLVIRQHLLTISVILNPDESKLEDLEASLKGNIALAVPDDGSTEAKFVNNIVGKAKNVLGNMKGQDYTVALMEMVNSGIVSDMITGLSGGVDSGEMNMAKLFSSLQAAASTFIQPTDEE